MGNAAIKKTNQGMAFLLFFNSKEVYSSKLFDSERKARNYAKKYCYTVHDRLPDGIDQHSHID